MGEKRRGGNGILSVKDPATDCMTWPFLLPPSLLPSLDMTLHAENWRRVLLIAFMIAQKTWDDRALRNKVGKQGGEGMRGERKKRNEDEESRREMLTSLTCTLLPFLPPFLPPSSPPSWTGLPTNLDGGHGLGREGESHHPGGDQ
jgi:hypothetical protein